MSDTFIYGMIIVSVIGIVGAATSRDHTSKFLFGWLAVISVLIIFVVACQLIFSI